MYTIRIRQSDGKNITGGYCLKWKLKKTKTYISKTDSEYALWRVRRGKSEVMVGRLILNKAEFKDLTGRFA